MQTRSLCAFALGCALSINSALAGLNDPISFSQAGAVSVTLDESSGGYDHILELSNTSGPVGLPLLTLTDIGAPSSDVLGFTPATIGQTVAVGNFTAGQEIGFRLTNVESARLGTPGVINSQVFSGTANILNPSPANYYTYIDVIDATTIKVYFEDIFGIDPATPDPVNAFLGNGYDAVFTLRLTEVPEPSSLALLATVIAMVGWRIRTHR